MLLRYLHANTMQAELAFRLQLFMEISTCKWRIGLSIASLLLSIGMSPWFYGGLLAHSTALYFFVTYCLNLVPGALSNISANYQLHHQMLYWTHGYWVRYLFWEHQFMVFVFWWWVGWNIDLKTPSRDCGLAWTGAEVVLGLSVSLVLLSQYSAYGRIFPPYLGAAQWPLVVWGLGLLCYSVSLLPRAREMFRSA